MKPVFSFIICFHFFLALAGQSREEPPIPVYEKVYLHTDRELYSPGDTIWFKSYLASGISNQLLPGFKNVYVQLISMSGEVISNRLLLSVNGESNGEMALKDSLAEGQYIIRAYTKYLQNFREESYFHKRIWIAKSGYFNEGDSIQSEKPKFGEAMFFPEGGNLVYNTANHVAFKVVGTDGKGIEASGAILNQDKDTITTFSTSFLGMGRFMLMPKEDEKYFAEIDNNPESRQEITNILKDGFALNIKDNGNEVLFTVSRNFEKTGKERLYLEAAHKGIQLFWEEIEIESFTTAIQIIKSRFPKGISKITLKDENSNIVSERLVFIALNYDNNVKIETGKNEYATREKVELNIDPVLSPGDSVTSTLSVSVVSEDYLGSAGSSQNIKSYLLLDSDLKGAIESPVLYFFDEEKIKAAEKLNLLMMVQGWRSYYWDEIIEKAPEGLDGWDDAGITVSGTLKQLRGDEPIADGKVQLSSFSPLMVEKAKINNMGQFSFERLFLKDSAEVILMGVNEKGRSNVKVIPNLQEALDTIARIEIIDSMLFKIEIPLKYVRDSYLKQLVWQKFDPDKGNILLEEVSVSARRIDNTQQVLFYKPNMYLADDSYLITNDDYKYGNVYNFLREKAKLPAGEWVTRPPGLFISLLQYCLDGDYKRAWDIYDESWDVLGLPIKDIYQIDVDKNVRVIRAMVYVYTKKLELREPSNNTVRGREIIRVDGFQKPNKFYSPKYTPENLKSIIPDFRPTLYWSPEVIVNEGKTEIEFFTCDNLSNYVVIVAGISTNGKICYGVKRFKVNRQYNN